MSNHEAVLKVMEAYFEGIYAGNAAALRGVFHPTAQVTDNVKGEFRSRSAEEYILSVASRQSPQTLGEARTMRAITVEVLDGVASVTARMEMLGQRYFNVLSMLQENGQWLIVHKLFGNIAS